MQELGQLLLVATFFVTLATMVTAGIGAYTGRGTWIRAARHGLAAIGLMTVALSLILTHGFLTHAFESKYIYEYSERVMPLMYKLAAFWGGERGALLFWVTSLAVFSNIAVFTKKDRSPVYMSWVVALLSSSILFFLVLMVFQTSPFDTWIGRDLPPADGNGLNPLLQNPVMAFHPPALLAGYILFTIPFAFGMAALIINKLDDEWIADTRRWTLISWTFLSVGLLLGARWAYMEIGWGFWWMWDAVENAGLIPWFTSTAFIHSVMIQERRGMLKRWNMVLLALTFLLTILGTWLTRSQIIISIHAFANSQVSDYYLWYMAIITIFSVWMIGLRWKELRSEASIESFMSREAMFVLNNIVFLFCAGITLWGTLMPKFSEWTWVRELFGFDNPILWDEGTFDTVFVPIGIVMLIILGIGPLISWRKATVRNFQRNFAWPLGWGSLATLLGVLMVAFFDARALSRVHEVGFWGGVGLWAQGIGATEWIAVLVYWLSAFVLFSIAREFHLAARVRQRQGLGGYWGNILVVLFRNPRRYGGYVVHIGVIFLFIAFTGKAFKHEERDRLMAVGDTHEVDRYAISMVDRDHFFSDEHGCVVSNATFVAMPQNKTVSDGSLKRLQDWLEVRDAGTYHLKTDLNRPFMEVRFQDGEERRAMVMDYFLARRFLPDFKEVRAQRAALMEIWTFTDTNLGQVQEHVMERMTSTRDAFLASDLAIEPELIPGTFDIKLHFRDQATQDLFHTRLAEVEVPDWVLTVYDDEERGAVSVVDRSTGDVLVPESRFFATKNTSTTEVAISADAFIVDLYLSMQPDMGRSYVKLLTVIFPLVNFLWIGGLLLMLGSLICLSPRWVARAIASFVQGGNKRASPVRPTMGSKELPTGGALALKDVNVLDDEVEAPMPTRRKWTIAFMGVVGLLLFVGTARAQTYPVPHGFPTPAADAGADLLNRLNCGCPLAPGQTEPVALGDPSCACEEASKDRAVALDIYRQQSEADRASGMAFYKTLIALIEVDPAFEPRLRYRERDFERLLETTRSTCSGEYLMTLKATRATCSHRMRWARDFRLLLASGVSNDDIFAFYVADNNARELRGPWEPHELRTSDETLMSYWFPALIVTILVGFIGAAIYRNSRRAKARELQLAGVNLAALSEEERGLLEREARVRDELSQNDRDRLRDELEVFDL